MKDLLKALQPIEGVELNQVITLTPEQAEQALYAVNVLENLKELLRRGQAVQIWEAMENSYEIEIDYASIAADDLLTALERAIDHL